MGNIVNLDIKIYKAETIYIRQTDFTFEDGITRHGALIVDENLKTFVYPIESKINKELDFLKEMLRKKNLISQDVLQRSYRDRKTIFMIGNKKIDWEEYESVFSGEEYYEPMKKAEILQA